MTNNLSLKSALKKVKAQEDNLGGFMDRFDIDEHYAVIKAIEEIQQYRAIGTVEECREAVEKQKAKKLVIQETNEKYNYKCECGNILLVEYKDGYRLGAEYSFCENCGQKLDWEFLLKIEKWLLDRCIDKDTLEYEDYLSTIKKHEKEIDRIYMESKLD